MSISSTYSLQNRYFSIIEPWFLKCIHELNALTESWDDESILSFAWDYTDFVLTAPLTPDLPIELRNRILFIAIQLQDEGMVSNCLQEGANINAIQNGRSVLEFAEEKGNVDILKNILDYKSDVKGNRGGGI